MSNATRHRFVYIYPYEPGAYEARVHGRAVLIALGYEVEVLVIPALPGSPRMLHRTYDWSGVHVTVAPDAASLASYLTERASSSVFVDFLFGAGEPTYRGRYVRPAVSRAGGVCCLILGGALPPTASITTRSVLRRRLKLATNPARLGDFLGRKLGAIMGLMRSSPLPVRVFAGNSEELHAYLARTQLPDSSVTWINSFDYDVFIQYVSLRGGVLPEAEQIAVFLDEDASGHADFGLLADSSMLISPDEYSVSLKRLFNAVERHTGLRVVIAAHPRSDYATRPGFFGDREIISGATVDLVARSSLVIAHASTAVNFAVLADRPLMIVKTASMLSSSYGATVDRVAAGLALEPVCSDAPGVLDSLSWEFMGWSQVGYPAYLERYIRSPEAPADRSTWQIVAETLQSNGYASPHE